MALVDLNNGNIKRVASRENGQTRYGANVITRIAYAMKGASEALELKKSIKDTIEGLLESILKEENIHPHNIYKMVVVGNTCMHHLFLGLSISKLAVAPFISSCKSALDIEAEEIKVIGNGIPKGICGSGLVQSISEMKRIGIIDKRGTFQHSDTIQSISKEIKKRIRKGKEGLEFVLFLGEEQNKDIVINQKDIRQFQLAKSAISAGIKAILKKGNISIEELDKIYVAETFAMYLDVESCIEVGLLPNIRKYKIIKVGNAAHMGAVEALLYKEKWKQAKKLEKDIKHVELSKILEFNQNFSRCMYIDNLN